MELNHRKAKGARKLAPLHPLAIAIRIGCASLSFGTCMAHAQAPAPRTAPGIYDIPAGPLAQALNRFAQLTGTAIVVDTEKVKGLHSPGLKGQYRVEDGFNALLSGTGFVIGKTAAGYLVMPGAAPDVSPTRPSTASSARAARVAIHIAARDGGRQIRNACRSVLRARAYGLRVAQGDRRPLTDRGAWRQTTQRHRRAAARRFCRE